MPRSWTSPGTAIMVRDHLALVKEDYPYHIWRTVEAQVKAMNHRKKPYMLPSWNSIRSMIYVLKQLGLIVGPRRVESEQGRKAKSTATFRGHTFPDRLTHLYYYKLNQDRIHDEGWENPFDALYKPDLFKTRSTRGIISKTSPEESRHIRPERM